MATKIEGVMFVNDRWIPDDGAATIVWGKITVDEIIAKQPQLKRYIPKSIEQVCDGNTGVVVCGENMVFVSGDLNKSCGCNRVDIEKFGYFPIKIDSGMGDLGIRIRFS